MFNLYKLTILILISFLVTIFSQSKLRVGNVYPGEVEMGGFNLSEDSIIEISGEGASFDKWESFLCYYSWILKSDTREVVWRSQNSDDFSKSDGEYDFDTELNLKAGDYEVYFTAGRENEKILIDGLAMLEDIFQGRRSNISRYSKEFFVEISNDGELLKIVDPIKLVNHHRDAIVSLIRVGDSENLEKGFTLTEETRVKIYSLGEGIKSEFYDFGYIYDVSKNKKVWMFNRGDANYAGGGKKNVEFNKEITLPKGSYKVHYQSDDSHSFDEWNVLPPNDPQYWGMEVSLVNKNDIKNIIPFRDSDIVKPFLDLTKVESDELVSQGFTVQHKVNIRIISVGEGYKSLADYGWIENADTKEIVWRMTYNNSEYAGGARKNRIFDDELTFEPGNYIAHFITDDSHNFGDWNDNPPFEADKWGISLWTLDRNDTKYVKLFNEQNYKSNYLIVDITKVRDDQNLSKKFILNKNSMIHIIAIGESSGNELVDFAWITNKNNKTVWEMNYNETSHAGGAKKNRIYNSVIKLNAGSYRVHYQTDDSHSFEEWNSSPPDNPIMYGITILHEK